MTGWSLVAACARAVEAVEVGALVEQRRLGRVEVLRLARAHDAPAEGDDAAAPVVDGKHHAAAEAIVGLAVAVVGLDGEPGLDDLVDRHVLALEVRQQAVARIRREAQAEIVDGRVLEAAAAQIVQALPADRQAQLLLEPARGLFDDLLQRRDALGALALDRRGARHRQVDLARQLLDRLGKRQALGLHDEAHGIALLVAAEAVEEALLVVDREGRRLLVVERAEAGVLRARPAFQRDLAADDLGQAEARAQFVEEARGEGHGAV